MSAWATRRRLYIGGGFFLFVALIFFLVIAAVFYDRPTCSDGKRNGSEDDVDCGGTCKKVCSAQAVDPVVHWSRIFNTKGNVYNLVAFVENPNTGARTVDTNYIFDIFDKNGERIQSKLGKISLLPRENIPLFEQNLILNATPTRAVFKFLEPIQWQKSEPKISTIRVENKKLTELSVGEKLDAEIVNSSVDSLQNIELVAVIYDINENAVAVSRTYLDALLGGERKKVTFTWPKAIDTGQSMCEVPVDTILAIDRSGSMKDDGTNPDEPFTSVKKAAVSFINSLGENDQVGALFFANNAEFSTTSILSNNFSSIKETVEDALIKNDGPQNTNIADAFSAAQLEFESSRHNQNATKVFILLTDGMPTVPRDPSARNEKFPEEQALLAADNLKKSNVEVFTIGLGTNLNRDFLNSISSGSDHVYIASSTTAVKKIYEGISTSICTRGPTSIEIYSRVGIKPSLN